MFVNLTPIMATSGRSPLVSLMFPTLKDKITNVQKYCEDNPVYGATKAVPRFLPAIELEKIVKLETLTRHSTM
jgi:hypothetical protein